jgi:hypothetical protein
MTPGVVDANASPVASSMGRGVDVATYGHDRGRPIAASEPRNDTGACDARDIGRLRAR